MNSIEDENSSNLIKERIQTFQALGANPETVSRIFKKMEEFNYDRNALLIMLKHLRVIENTLKQKAVHSNIENPFESDLNFYISSFFMDKMGKFSNSTLPFNRNYEQPVKSIPVEAFLKSDKESIQKFERSLKMYDVIFGEIVQTDFKDENGEFLLLRIINKVDSDIIYHLNINVHLFKEQELALRGDKEFLISEILQVLVLGSIVNNGVVRHYGTTNLSILSKINASVNLVSLYEKKPAFDVNLLKETSKFPCYAHYLECERIFNEKHHLINGIKSIGLDPYHIYSFNEEEEGLISPKGFHVGALKNSVQEAQQKESNRYLEEANKCIERKDYINALSNFDEAIKIWPDNYKVFECRGYMYGDTQNRTICDLTKASVDFRAALNINPTAESSKKGLSQIYICIARKKMGKKKYEGIKDILQAAVQLDKDNEEANRLLQKVNKKMSSASGKSSDIELLALQKERKKLLLALDKE